MATSFDGINYIFKISYTDDRAEIIEIAYASDNLRAWAIALEKARVFAARTLVGIKAIKLVKTEA